LAIRNLPQSGNWGQACAGVTSGRHSDRKIGKPWENRAKVNCEPRLAADGSFLRPRESPRPSAPLVGNSPRCRSPLFLFRSVCICADLMRKAESFRRAEHSLAIPGAPNARRRFKAIAFVKSDRKFLPLDVFLKVVTSPLPRCMAGTSGCEFRLSRHFRPLLTAPVVHCLETSFNCRYLASRRFGV